MSKLGKIPVPIPAGVTVNVAPGVVTIKGPKGELKQDYGGNVKIEVKGAEVVISTTNATKQANADHGLYRSLIHNMVVGVSAGFTKSLVITGVGFRAEVKGKELSLNLGYSTDFFVEIPDGLTVTADANGNIAVAGIDKQKVGQFCAEIRALRKPEPYKGKGVRYSTEVIRRKVGKTGVK